MKKLFFISFMCIGTISFSQELSNDKYQKIIIMEGEKNGWFEIIADPMKFECECAEVISATVKPTSKKNFYKSDDGIIQMEIKDGKYIIKLSSETDCCYIRAGVYSN